MKKNNIIFGVLLLLVVITATGVSGTYARYITSDEGTATVSAAAWVVDIQSGGSAFKNSTLTLTPTTSSTNIAANRIAPSFSASGTINVDLRGTEVSTDLYVDIDYDTMSGLDSAILTLLEETGDDKVDIVISYAGSSVTAGSLPVDGTITHGTPITIPYSEIAAATKPFDIVVTLTWKDVDDELAEEDPNEHNNIDTAVGELETLTARTIEIPIIITAKQHV